MPKRPAWRPSDIRDWGNKPGSARRSKAQPPTSPLPPETGLRVEVGRETLSMKLRDFADLLSQAELGELAVAIAEGCSLSVPAHPGRTAMVISAPGGQGAAGAEE